MVLISVHAQHRREALDSRAPQDGVTTGYAGVHPLQWRAIRCKAETQ